MPDVIPPAGALAATTQRIAAWETQVSQYPPSGPPGLGYFAGVTPAGTIDCLLWRNEAGQVVGILNHYPFRTPGGQEPGTMNVWVDPAWQRRGIGHRLARAAAERWGADLGRQSYTEAGARAVTRWYEERVARLAAESGDGSGRAGPHRPE